MQSQFFKWRKKNLRTGKEEYSIVQGALRPSVFGAWEYVFPEEALPEVLAMMNLKKDSVGASRNFINKSRLAMLRRIFGAKKIPKKIWKQAEKCESKIVFEETERAFFQATVQGVSIHPIGIKKDKRKKKPEWGVEQEML